MVSSITDRVYGESASVAVKAPCIAASAGVSLPLNGLTPVGSYTPFPGDRILVKDQDDPSTNGIYNASTGAWARAGDFDGPYDVLQGTLIVIVYPNGGATIYQLSSINPIIGTSPLIFTPLLNTNETFPQTPTEAIKGIVPTNTTYPQGYVRRYGGVLDGGTDDCAAMVQAAAVGGKIVIDGPMAMASASLALLPNTAIELISGTTIECWVGNPITITGNSACNVFHSTDASNIEMLDVYVVGNGVATPTTGFIWYILCTAAAVKPAVNLKFIRGGGENFGGLYWIYVDNTAFVNQPFSRFLADGCSFTSKPGNCQTAGLTTTTTTASIFGFSGSDTATSAYSVKDVEVRNCTADGTYIKEFLFFWSGVYRSSAHDNTLYGFGTDASISDDTACYALAAYDHSHGTGLRPQLIEFYDNTINLVRDVGIYHASANQLDMWGNRISGQTSVANGTLPKGGIAGDSRLVTISDNVLTNCAIGLSIVQDPDGLALARANNNVIQAMPVNGVGVQISGSTGGNAIDIGINGLTIDTELTGGKGIHIVATSAVGINNLDIQNVDIHNCANGIDLFAPDSSVPNLGNVRFRNVKLRHITGNCLQWLNCTNAASRTSFTDIDFMDMVPGAVGLFIVNGVNLTIRNITFYDLISGATACWYGAGAQGRVSNVQFVNVANGNKWVLGGSDLALVAPAWTGALNDSVQNLNPTVTGSGGFGTANQKHWTAGWQWDNANAAWAPDVRLTGT